MADPFYFRGTVTDFEVIICGETLFRYEHCSFYGGKVAAYTPIQDLFRHCYFENVTMDDNIKASIGTGCTVAWREAKDGPGGTLYQSPVTVDGVTYGGVWSKAPWEK